MGRSYTIKYFGKEIDKEDNFIFKDAGKTRQRLFTGMSIKEVLRDALSGFNYELKKGMRFLIYEQVNPSKEFKIEIIKDLKVNPEIEENIIKSFNGFDYWNFTFKGYYKKEAV